MSSPRITGAIGGALAVLLGLVVLAGWAIHSTLLIQITPNLAPMLPTTAATFVVTGLTLLVTVTNRRQFAFIGTAIMAVLAGGLLIARPVTAVCFLVLATGFALVQTHIAFA
jgi:hypothetical protein